MALPLQTLLSQHKPTLVISLPVFRPLLADFRRGNPGFMKSFSLFMSSLSPLPLILQCPPSNSLDRAQKPFPFLHRPTSFLRFSPVRFPGNFISKVANGLRFDGPVVDLSELAETEDGDLVVETCVTRTLPPALTLELGLESIKEAVEELKLSPPSSSGGVMRFQVAVPPNPKAFYWFCCQPESSGVFPLFFLSKDTKNPTCKSLYVNSTYGVFGIGAAIIFSHSSSYKPEGPRAIKRYLSNDSIPLAAYGFMDIDLDMDASIKHEAGSFYFCIPQIELNEHEDVSILTATLAWDESHSYTFEQAICNCESSFYQVTHNICPTAQRDQFLHIKAALRKLGGKGTETGQMVYVDALSLGGRKVWADPAQLRKAPSSNQFFFLLSPSIAIANNMLDHANKISYFPQDHANINAIWASLIVEECSRLGLTYFCVAPGSRSTPLAIAATSHPLITCVSCFDERSLAFHAVGYARGSFKPAVIITSSGTAVSNLFPAVVEASQDFLPLLLLTADRPPELHDAGANQAINQVNHFGSYVRFFFSLPPPTDQIPVRMVLTTLDSAVHWATSLPYGPVHINCPFREPLDGGPSKWSRSCLKGLDFWGFNAEPFTKYFRVQHSYASRGDTCNQIPEVLEVIRGAEKGLLLVGAIHREDEIWAVLLLARQLLWPVVADILSGLRLRKILASFPEVKENCFFVDHLDHALLSEAFAGWMKFDVVLQIGSRITSKRVLQMLEECFPFSYILVANHPCRHDPSHLVTHRVQSTVVQFVDHILSSQIPRRRSKLLNYLQALDNAIAWEISFQTWVERSLTEPYVAHILSKALTPKSAIFIGNSMPIRDADCYGRSWGNYFSSRTDLGLSSVIPCHWIQVAGNRGASGIDGLLSTGLGFAVGCKKRVLCLIGDISFLHDTNGLLLLKQRTSREPVTILVINNHGGAIFSLLPIANKADPSVLNQYFYTSHNISLEKLCLAHGVKHQLVRTKDELQYALFASQHEEMDCVVEVESSISANASFHSVLRKFACQAADHALEVLSRSSLSTPCGYFLCEIHQMHYSLYTIQLCDRPTSSYADNEACKFYREGFILTLTLEDGSIGLGEVAPLEIHEEDLMDVEEQLRFLIHVIKGIKINYLLPLLRGSFSSWLWSELGIPVSSVFPSVRCGLEMAVLNAIAAKQGCTLLKILCPQSEKLSEGSSSVPICALIDSRGTPAEVAYIAKQLVDEGFYAIKLKVARYRDPFQDAAVIWEVRRMVGHQTEIRADANRNWSYEEAIKFSSLVKSCNLQYVEEPVKDESDIIKYCVESGLPVALDETVDGLQRHNPDMINRYVHPGIVAIVIKPSVVGGFENAAFLAKWAHQHGKMAVISAAFESGYGLSAYIMFSLYLKMQNSEICRELNRELGPPVAHGLGTYRWLKEDVVTDSLRIRRNPCSGYVEAFADDASRILQKSQINQDVIVASSTGEEVRRYTLRVDMEDISHLIKIHEVGQRTDENIILFLHGFLGTGRDWVPIMKGLSGSARCISIDLPGHGGSKIQNRDDYSTSKEPKFSIEMISDTLCKLIQQITLSKVTLVGYSMGARIALYMALRCHDKINGVVVMSGSPGIKDPVARKLRRAVDDSRARMLVTHRLQIFLENWYSSDLWKSLRNHPHFAQIAASRMLHEDVHSLARVLPDLSAGRQQPLWEELKQCKVKVLLVVGEDDAKFKGIAGEMLQEMSGSRTSNGIMEIVEIPEAGHAVHLENCLPVIRTIRKFLRKVQDSSL